MNSFGEIVLFCLAVVLCLSCKNTRTNEPLAQDSSAKKQIDKDVETSSTSLNNASILGKYSKDQVLNSLNHNIDSILRWSNVDLQEWKYMDSSVIVLNEIELVGEENRSALEISLLKEVEGSLRLIAKGTISSHSDSETDYYLINTRFDTNTYKIHEGEYAIGVIGTPTWVSNGPSYYNYGTELILFRIVKNKITPVILLPLEYTHGDRHQENDSTIIVDNEDEELSEVMLSGRKTNDFFDIILKTKTTSISSESEQPTVTTSSATYVWRNDMYVKVKE